MTGCPTADRLDLWVNERLDPAEQAALAAHVDGCANCQAALDRLTAGPPAVEPRPDPGIDELLRPLRDTLPFGPAGAADADRPALPGYELLEVVGRGGMGVVYRARQRGVNREVAVKLLHRGPADGEEAARFRREGEALGRLRHPNVVQVFDVGVADGRPYLVMEYLPGGPLSKRADGQPLPPAAAAALVEPVARAVQHAHEQGILHRDLKPGNILLSGVRGQGTGVSQDPALTPVPCPLTPKVADFGLARSLDAGESLTLTGAILGTPNYMAPEQVAAEGRLTAACDVYGLGAVLYELLTGRPPFAGATPTDVLLQVRHQDPVPPSRVIPTLPRDLNTVCLRCLEKDPTRRYASAAAVAEDLRRWRAGEPILARPAGAAEKVWKWARRRKAAAAAAGLGLFLLLVGLPTVTALWLRADDQRRRADAEVDRADRSLYAAHIAQAELHYRLNDLARTRFHLQACRPAVGRPDRRGWEWAYLNGLAYSEHVNLPAPPPPDGRARTLYAVAFRPDGRRLAAGGGTLSFLSNSGREPGELALWDPTAGQSDAGPADPEPLPVTALAYGADGRLFTVGADVWHRSAAAPKLTGPRADPPAGPAGLLRARDPRTGSVLFERPFPPPYRDLGPGHPERPTLAVSPDGSRVAVGTAVGLTVFDGRTGEPRFDRPGGLTAAFDAAGTLWTLESGPRPWPFDQTQWLVAVDPRTGREVGRRGVGPPSGRGRAFGPSGRYLARVTAPGDAVLTPTGGGAEVRVRLGVPADQVTTLALSRDDQLLATGGPDGTVRVWEVRTSRARQVFRGHVNRVLAVAFDPAGRQVASVGWDRTAKVWDLAHAPEFTTVGEGAEFVRRAEDCVFVDGGRHLRIARVPGGGLEEWDTVTGAVRPLGTLDVTADKMRVPFPGRSAAFAADGRRVAAVRGADGQRQVGVWAVHPFAPVGTFAGCRVPVRFLALSAAGDRLAAAAWDRRDPDRADLFVWDVDRQAVLVRAQLDGEACTALALSPDGRRVVVATGSLGADSALGADDPRARLRVWDVDAGRELAPLDPHGEVTALAFDGDGGRLAAATAEPRVRIWDARSGAAVRDVGCLEPYASLAFAPDGRRLVGGTNELVTLWDPAAGEEMLTLRGRPRAGSELPLNPRVVFDASGAKLAAAQSDFSVYIWTAAGYGRK